MLYHKPKVLNAKAHGKLKFDRSVGFGFAKNAVAVPAIVSEFAQLIEAFPIVFAENEEHSALVLMGVRNDNNLFIDDEGHWQHSTYIPSYLRRYPFIFAEASENRFALSIDEEAPHLNSKKGEVLYEDEQATDFLKGALQHCEGFHKGYLITKAFCAALKEKDLLKSVKVDFTIPGSTKAVLHGFKMVDEAKLRNLDDETVMAWWKNGWLSLIHLHLASLSNLKYFLRLETEKEPAEQAA